MQRGGARRAVQAGHRRASRAQRAVEPDQRAIGARPVGPRQVLSRHARARPLWHADAGECCGIGEIEHFVHGLAMRHGGQDATLRRGNVLDLLPALARSGALDERDARSLVDAYGWLRRAEHFLQLAQESAPPVFPDARAAQIGLARSMGYREVDAESALRRLLRDRSAVRAQVMALVSDPAKRRAQDRLA